MTYYFVKEIATATDDNPSFKGETKTYYVGKGGWLVYNPFWEQDRGWKRRRFAERYIEEECKSKEKYWTNKYEVIEITD